MDTKMKYKVISDADIKSLKEKNLKIKKSRYRQKFHIQAITGLLNDPNGFSYFNDKWHLFYQWFPFSAMHGAKNWYYISSDDLIYWENKGLALKPDTIYDNRGVYSGSALVHDNKLHLFYTGNHKDKQDIRHPYQCIAVLDEKDGFKKCDKPIISMSDNYTEHQRDPKIMFENGKYYIMLGAQNLDLKGRVILYSSNNLYSNWSFLGELKVRGYEDFGYMWECPDLIKIKDKYILLFSPQGIEKKAYKYNNIYQNGYIIGSMDFDNLEFIPESEFEELDRGFDFYASQSAYQSKYTGSAVYIAWLGLPDSNYTTDEEDWSGCLSLVRQVSIEDGKLIQRPIESVKNLRYKALISERTKSYNHKLSSPMEILLQDINSTDIRVNIYSKDDNKSGFEVRYSDKILSISKEHMDNKFNESQGLTRSIELNNLNSLNIFIDSSSIEIFINDGQYTMSSRVFPSCEENMLNIKSDNIINTTIWNLKESISEDFVI